MTLDEVWEMDLSMTYFWALIACLPFFFVNVFHRYDDTNPEAEKKEYIDHIEEIVKWMGWEPFKVI